MVKENSARKLNSKTKFLIGLFLVFTILFLPSVYSAGEPWWNTSFEFRQEINISTSAGATPANYQIELDLDNTNVGANFNWSRSCEDLRVLDNQTKLDYWIQSCNSVSEQATIWVKMPLSFTTAPKTLHIYYGNLNVNNESSGDAVFDFFDDFSGDLSKWTEHKNPDKIFIVDNYLQISGATTSAPYGHSVIGSDATYSGFLNGIIDGELYLDTNAIAEMGFRGNYASNTGYKSRADARPSEGVSHLKPPYNGWGFLAGCSATGGGITTHTWLPFSITVNSNTFNIVTQGKSVTCTDNSYNTAGEISFHNHYGLYSRFDNIRVRKYFASNVNIVYGVEESLGLLDFSFLTPSSVGIGYIFKDDVFNISIAVSCRKKASPFNCGDINFSLRYNDTSTTFENISLSSTTPLWITSPAQSYSLVDDETHIISWLLNGSGNAGDSFLLDVFAVSSDAFTFNQKSAENGHVIITNQPIVAFNQSIYDFGSFFKNSGNKLKTLSILADLGISTNVTVTCESGDCSMFSDDWVDGTDMNDGDSSLIDFTCFESISGDFNAIFSVSSNENPMKSFVDLSCSVDKIYGPIMPHLIIPVENTSINVMQNETFKINASVDCVGNCGEITAFALYDSYVNTWKNVLYPFKQNITLTSATSINSGYQTLLSFDSSNIGINFDWSNNCEDIAFYTNYDELSFWVESCNVVGEEMKVWIKTNNQINVSGYDFRMYYGYINTSKSNGESVFNFFDDFLGSSLNLSKWNLLYDQGWSVSGGELIGTNTNGILHSVNSFSNPVILETKTKMVTRAANGMMSLGFYSSAGDGVGIQEINVAPGQYYYRNNGAWSSATAFDSLYNYHYNKFSIDSSNNVVLTIVDLIDGTTSTKSFSNTVNLEKIALGRKYDNANLNQAYNQRWDWIRTRMYSAIEPTILISNEDKLNIISTNVLDIPFYTFNLQPQSCNPIEDGSCSFEWLVNVTGLINSSYNVSVLFLSNYSNILSATSGFAQVNIVNNLPPLVNLISPNNNSKILISNDFIELKYNVSSIDTNVSCALFVNGIFNTTHSCNVGENNFNLSVNRGAYNWYIQSNNSLASTDSQVFNFNIIEDYDSRISKKISNINLDLYKLELNIENRINSTNNIIPIDFVDNRFNYGSFSTTYDWLNLTNGLLYNGSILGWDLNLIPLANFNINYSVTKNVDDYYLLDEFIIGLE